MFDGPDGPDGWKEDIRGGPSAYGQPIVQLMNPCLALLSDWHDQNGREDQSEKHHNPCIERGEKEASCTLFANIPKAPNDNCHPDDAYGYGRQP